jgi:hypothetical protein
MNYGPIPKKRARGKHRKSPSGWIEHRNVKRKNKRGDYRHYEQWFYCWHDGESQQFYLSQAKRQICYQALAAGQSVTQIKALLGVNK